MFRTFDVVTSFLATLARLGGGHRLAEVGPRPAQRLILYDFEGCPFCRRAREAVSQLDLEVEIRPCPKQGPRFRPEVVARGGRSMFPYLVDPNTGDELYESADIVRHLYRTYGTSEAPTGLTWSGFVPTSVLASGLRGGRGSRYAGDPSRAPSDPLVLYGMESSPFTRLVREVLSELELAYVLRTTPVREFAVFSGVRSIFREVTGIRTGQHRVASARWKELERDTGEALVPYLIDPNTGVAMHQSADIIAYLRERYGR
jgi:glutathione S-transferase